MVQVSFANDEISSVELRAANKRAERNVGHSRKLTNYDIDFCFHFFFTCIFIYFFSFFIFSFSCSVTIGYCSLHQKGIRQKVQSHLALYRWSEFRFVCNARDTSFHLLLFGSSGDFAVQKRLNCYFPFSSTN